MIRNLSLVLVLVPLFTITCWNSASKQHEVDLWDMDKYERVYINLLQKQSISKVTALNLLTYPCTREEFKGKSYLDFEKTVNDKLSNLNFEKEKCFEEELCFEIMKEMDFDLEANPLLILNITNNTASIYTLDTITINFHLTEFYKMSASITYMSFDDPIIPQNSIKGYKLFLTEDLIETKWTTSKNQEIPLHFDDYFMELGRIRYRSIETTSSRN